MVRGKAVAIWMVLQVRQSQRFRIEDEQAEHTFSGGPRSDHLLHFGIDADGYELSEPSVTLVENAESSVLGTCHGASFLDDVTKEDRQGEVGIDEEDSLEEPAELGRIFNASVGHRG